MAMRPGRGAPSPEVSPGRPAWLPSGSEGTSHLSDSGELPFPGPPAAELGRWVRLQAASESSPQGAAPPRLPPGLAGRPALPATPAPRPVVPWRGPGLPPRGVTLGPWVGPVPPGIRGSLRGLPRSGSAPLRCCALLWLRVARRQQLVALLSVPAVLPGHPRCSTAPLSSPDQSSAPLDLPSLRHVNVQTAVWSWIVQLRSVATRTDVRGEQHGRILSSNHMYRV